MDRPEFPTPVKINGRLYWERAALEAYKRALMGLPAVGTAATLELVPSALVTKEFGFGRRTLGRRVAASQNPKTGPPGEQAAKRARR